MAGEVPWFVVTEGCWAAIASDNQQNVEVNGCPHNH